MHIKFNWIRLYRFRSFLEESTLHFGDAGDGLYFLKGKNNADSALGSNGAGKSSILDALLWCLYGKTISGLKNTDITPWVGKGQTKVEIGLSVGKKTHVITRTANPNSLAIDGGEAGQDYVSDLIQIPFNVLPYTIVLGQDQPLFFDLPPSEQLSVLSDTLNLSRWDDRSDHCKAMVENLDKEISAMELEVVHQTKAVELLEADLATFKGKSKEWEDDRQDALEGHEKAREKVLKDKDRVQLLRDTADLALDRAETELRGSSLQKLKDLYREGQLHLAKTEIQLKDLIRKKAKLDADLIATDDSTCPTCRQPLNQAGKKQLLADSRTALKETTQQVAQLEAVVALVKSKQDQLTSSIDNEQSAMAEFLTGSINARDELLRQDRELNRIQAEIKVMDERIKEYADQDNPWKSQVQTTRKRISDTKINIGTTERNLESKRTYCERVRFWIKGFKDIKLYALEELLQEIEITTCAMLEGFGLVGWRIQFDVEKENKSGTIARGININVYSPSNEKPVKWKAWSGGEKQRLRIIGSGALSSAIMNRLGISTNLEAYDEPTKGLSKEGVEDLVDLLAQRAQEAKKCIWMIDHHAVETSKFAKTVLVTKDKEGSRII
jgi:DNA repair exonuclease SbcCD ATPase subunit